MLCVTVLVRLILSVVIQGYALTFHCTASYSSGCTMLSGFIMSVVLLNAVAPFNYPNFKAMLVIIFALFHSKFSISDLEFFIILSFTEVDIHLRDLGIKTVKGNDGSRQTCW